MMIESNKIFINQVIITIKLFNIFLRRKKGKGIVDTRSIISEFRSLCAFALLIHIIF